MLILHSLYSHYLWFVGINERYEKLKIISALFNITSLAVCIKIASTLINLYNRIRIRSTLILSFDKKRSIVLSCWRLVYAMDNKTERTMRTKKEETWRVKVKYFTTYVVAKRKYKGVVVLCFEDTQHCRLHALISQHRIYSSGRRACAYALYRFYVKAHLQCFVSTFEFRFCCVPLYECVSSPIKSAVLLICNYINSESKW